MDLWHVPYTIKLISYLQTSQLGVVTENAWWWILQLVVVQRPTKVIEKGVDKNRQKLPILENVVFFMLWSANKVILSTKQWILYKCHFSLLSPPIIVIWKAWHYTLSFRIFFIISQATLIGGRGGWDNKPQNIWIVLLSLHTQCLHLYQHKWWPHVQNYFANQSKDANSISV